MLQNLSYKDCVSIRTNLTHYAMEKGLEVHPFKVGWYNAIVGPRFTLPYHPDTVAFVVISQPCMFEKSFVPYLNNLWTNAKKLNQQNKMDMPDSCKEIPEIGKVTLSGDHDNQNRISGDSTTDSFMEMIKRDPLDQCMQVELKKLSLLIPDHSVDILHDFDMTPTRRPKILVQTAGYVAGAVNMFRREDLPSFKSKISVQQCSMVNNHSETVTDCNKSTVNGVQQSNGSEEDTATESFSENQLNISLAKEPLSSTAASNIKNSQPCSQLECERHLQPIPPIASPNGTSVVEDSADPWPTSKKIFPVCLHPDFGGWFALRGVMVLRNTTCEELRQQPPKPILEWREQVVELLERYNNNWKDCSFRDVISTRDTYSIQQREYFLTTPQDRAALLLQLVTDNKQK